MMRADIFSILSCSTNSDFVNQADITLILKKSVAKFLESEKNERVRNMGILSQLHGWNKLLN